MDYKAIVREHLFQDDRIDQLVEELAELSQACMKMKRAKYWSRNPTPVQLTDAIRNVQEEVGDVLMCLDALDWIEYDTSNNPKWERWANRLIAADERDVVTKETDE